LNVITPDVLLYIPVLHYILSSVISVITTQCTLPAQPQLNPNAAQHCDIVLYR